MKTHLRANIDKPQVQQQAVSLNISIYFGRHGRENLRQLKITEFAVTTDAAGDLYLYKSSDETTKIHKEDGHTSGWRESGGTSHYLDNRALVSNKPSDIRQNVR